MIIRGDAFDIAIEGETIAAVGPDLGEPDIDARGKVLLPGGVDAHVHFNEPGERTHWEGWATGSAALVAGGITTALEMPLNALPPTLDTGAFAAKRAAAEASSFADFGLWGGVAGHNTAQLPALADAGAIAFKAFMSASGVDDFPNCDDAELYDAMQVIAPTGRLLGLHAESDLLTRTLAARARAAGRTGVRDYLASRPAVAETQAIARAIELAAATACPLHIVHVSTGRGAALVAAARASGVDVTCEVTPHHLVLTEDDAEALGAIAKCAPPLRPVAETRALWAALEAGDVSFVASDHSPSPPDLREGDGFSAWGGIAGCQSTLELLLTEGMAPELLARVLCGAPASRFGLARKGALAPGHDADLVIVGRGERTLARDELLDRHKLSPYVGRTLTARVETTILRGEVVYRDGALVGPARGRMVQMESR